MMNGTFQLIRIEEFTQHKWVKSLPKTLSLFVTRYSNRPNSENSDSNFPLNELSLEQKGIPAYIIWSKTDGTFSWASFLN